MCLLLDAVLTLVKQNWTQIVWSTIHSVGGWEAEQIKQILKSSWQLNKTDPKAVCHGLVFKRWLRLSVSGFVRVLVSVLSSPSLMLP